MTWLTIVDCDGCQMNIFNSQYMTRGIISGKCALYSCTMYSSLKDNITRGRDSQTLAEKLLSGTLPLQPHWLQSTDYSFSLSLSISILFLGSFFVACINQGKAEKLFFFHPKVPVEHFVGPPNFCHADVFAGQGLRDLFATRPRERGETHPRRILCRAAKSRSSARFKSDALHPSPHIASVLFLSFCCAQNPCLLLRADGSRTRCVNVNGRKNQNRDPNHQHPHPPLPLRPAWSGRASVYVILLSPGCKKVAIFYTVKKKSRRIDV